MTINYQQVQPSKTEEKQIVNWNLHEYCPTCKEKRVRNCRCFKADSTCANGHNWFVCFKHGKTVLGQSDHGKNTFDCSCDSTAFYRTEK